MQNKTRHSDAFLNHMALALTGFGLILLLLKIASAVYIRLSGGSVFGGGFLDSSADSHRFIAYVGTILVGGLIYSWGGVGRALSEVVGAIVIWQIILWYVNYQSYISITNFWQFLDAAAFALIFLATGLLLAYIPIRSLISLTHRSGTPTMAR